MQLNKPIAVMLLIFVSLELFAQDVSHSQVYQAQQNIQNGIKGTLDGVVKIPQKIRNNVNTLVFPRSFNRGFSINPWSNAQQKPRSRQALGYSGMPQGNPWAPIGDNQNIPFDPTNSYEKNPYTDAPAPSQNIPPYGYLNNNYGYGNNQNMGSPYGRGYGNAFDNSSGGFSTPFGNNFWPGGNNGNSSMPFMPW